MLMLPIKFEHDCFIGVRYLPSYGCQLEEGIADVSVSVFLAYHGDSDAPVPCRDNAGAGDRHAQAHPRHRSGRLRCRIHRRAGRGPSGHHDDVRIGSLAGIQDVFRGSLVRCFRSQTGRVGGFAEGPELGICRLHHDLFSQQPHL